MKTIRIYCLALLLGLLALPALAQTRNTQNRVEHYVGFSLAGGLAANTYQTPLIENQAGAAADLKFHYELHKSKWIIGLGVEAEYQYLRDTVADFTDSKDWKDRDGDACSYQYVYQGYHETDHALGIAIPVHFGREFGDYVYTLIGARFYIPLYTQSLTHTRLLTQGNYDWNIDPIRTEGINDYSIYGYYANSEYDYAYTYEEFMRVGAWLEIGSYIPLKKAKKTRLRAGLYANYDWRLGSVGYDKLADYRKVDMSPRTINQENLRANIRWNAVNTTDLVRNMPANFEVGVRMTMLIDVTTSHVPCMCNSMY